MHIEARDARWAAAHKAEFDRWTTLPAPSGKSVDPPTTLDAFERTTSYPHHLLIQLLPRSRVTPVPDHAPEALFLAAEALRHLLESLDGISRVVEVRGGSTAVLEALRAAASPANLAITYADMAGAMSAMTALDTATQRQLWSAIREAWLPLRSDRRKVRDALHHARTRVPQPSGAILGRSI